MRVILLALLCISSVFVNASELSHEHIQIGRAMLESYMQKADKELFKVYHFIFAKAYSLNSEEAIVRYKLFKKAVKFVKKHNAKNLSWTVGLNQFADMTDEEYKQYNGISPEMLKLAERTRDRDEPDPIREDKPDPIRGLKFLNSANPTFLFDELADKVDKKVKHDCDESSSESSSDNYEDDSDGCDKEEDDKGNEYEAKNRDYFQNLTDVRNQGGCGSCWAFSTTLLLETGYNHRNQLTGDKKIAALSPQQLVDCDKSSSGCSGGWMPYALKQVKNNGGIEYDYHYNYNAVQGSCKEGNNKLINLKGSGYTGCAPYFGLQKCSKSVWYKLIEEGPCAVAIDTNNSEFKYYQSGIMDIAKTNGCGNVTHAVVAYSWKHEKNDDGTIREYIGVRNSWSANWGEKGDFRIFYHEQSESCKITQFCIQPDWA